MGEVWDADGATLEAKGELTVEAATRPPVGEEPSLGDLLITRDDSKPSGGGGTSVQAVGGTKAAVVVDSAGSGASGVATWVSVVVAGGRGGKGGDKGISRDINGHESRWRGNNNSRGGRGFSRAGGRGIDRTYGRGGGGIFIGFEHNVRYLITHRRGTGLHDRRDSIGKVKGNRRGGETRTRSRRRRVSRVDGGG